MHFPDHFTWGAATSAYQIEGGWDADGKGPSIWDDFGHQPGKTVLGQHGDTACDHYHRYAEDVALMRELGLGAYRLSVSWPRVLPEGTGAVNAAGLDFYDRLVDALCDAGIAPYVTLFHWDLPLALHRRGGWLNRESAGWFADYAGLVAARLGDRVAHWITINEPTIILLCGYWEGGLAPGWRVGLADLLQMAHHLLLAHGRGVQALRAAAPRAIQVGWTHASAPSVPAMETPADVDAARQRTFALPDDPHTDDFHTNSWWNDPVYLGRYPQAPAGWQACLPRIQADDLATISVPVDFCGLNIYHSHLTRAGAAGPEKLPWPEGRPRTMMRWPVTPEALYWGPRFFHERYGRPVFIFESGMAGSDVVARDGVVHDPYRIDYHHRYLRAFARAGQDGVDIRGYFAWSLLDVLEWSDGYTCRFGLVHVDRDTLARTPKDSFHWYRQVIATNGAEVSGA